MADSESVDSKLAALAPAARARVEAALKEAVERELASGPTALAEKEFSKGWFFSRSRPTTKTELEMSVIQQAATLDDKAFTAFANRLRALKGMMKDGEGSGG